MLDFIHHLASVIPTGGAVAIIAGAVDFILRLVKSSKPLSLAHLIADAFKGLGNLFQALGDFLDKILPQRVDPPKQ